MKRKLLNILDLDAPALPLPPIDEVKTANDMADQWLEIHAENIDEDSEECLSHYLESNGFNDFPGYPYLADTLANNAFYRAGL